MTISKYLNEMLYSELTEEEWEHIAERIRPKGDTILQGKAITSTGEWVDLEFDKVQGKDYTYIFIEETVTLEDH